MGRIVVLGIFVADAVYRAARQARAGETLIGSGFLLGPGGKGSNQAVAAGKLGADVALITRLGEDPFADMGRRIWAEAGVQLRAAIDAQSHTGSAGIFVDEESGENAIIVVPGAAGDLGPEDLAREAGVIGAADVFLTQLEQPMAAAVAGLKMAREAGATTILNPAPAAELPEEMPGLIDIITPNETEAEMLTGRAVTDEAGARAAGEALLDMGIGAAVITLGPRGAYLQSASRSELVPGFEVARVVDTTGAGDAFNGALATGLSQGMDMPAAIRFANGAAALSVTREGAAAASGTTAEVADFVAEMGGF